MIITLDKLEELDVGTNYTEWFTAKYDAKQIELSTLVKDSKADDRLDWIWRLLPKLMKDKVTIVKFAVYCAELVLPIFEQQKPDNKNPRLAIEATKAWIAKPCEETRKAADGFAAAEAANAAWTTTAAAYAASSAATAAYVANGATWVTTWAANGAANAAYDAAYAAALATKETNAEFHAEVVNKIIKYGLELLED